MTGPLLVNEYDQALPFASVAGSVSSTRTVAVGRPATVKLKPVTWFAVALYVPTVPLGLFKSRPMPIPKMFE